jgi:CheY-like chemotaxis protein
VCVLVVDDNMDAALTLAELLDLCGHETHVAHDGPTALEVARVYRPEVILLDIGLPGMDGYEVARQIGQEAGLSGALLVAVSGYGQEEDRRRARDAGLDHHLVKPVDMRELQRLISSAGRSSGAGTRSRVSGDGGAASARPQAGRPYPPANDGVSLHKPR